MPLSRPLVVAALLAACPAALAQSGKKVLFVNSYHQGYEWSDGIEEGAAKVLSASGVAVGLVTFLERTVGEGGTLVAKQDLLTKQSKDIDVQIAEMERRLESQRQSMPDEKWLCRLSRPASPF